MRVLKCNKKAIGWTLADIRGINPSFFMHRIRMEEGHKPSIKLQRRLNPNMKEVVKKEVIKWLDAGIIYPIPEHLGEPSTMCSKERRNESGEK